MYIWNVLFNNQLQITVSNCYESYINFALGLTDKNIKSLSLTLSNQSVSFTSRSIKYKTVLDPSVDSTLWIPDYWFPCTEFRIPKPTIPRSTSKDFLHFGFHKQKFCGFRNPGDLTWGRDTSGLPLCKNLWSGSFVLTYQWLLCIDCFTSLVSFTGF